MNKILIIGAGFAGLSAAERLSRSKTDIQVTVIDKKQTFDFLPSLPDCIGRRIKPEFLAYDINEAAQKFKFNYINDEVETVDLEQNQVQAALQSFDYDYLIIASGSETNFYGNENLQHNACKIDSVEDVAKLINIIKAKNFSNYFVCGGGYTGVEVATNLRLCLKKLKKRNRRVILVEHAPSILGPLPEWMKEYVNKNLRKLDIEVFLNSSVERVEMGSVFVYGNKIFDDALLIWAAGVKTAPFIQNINAEKNPQGRLKVNSFLRLKHNCFVAGDAAYFTEKKSFLRMAVMFSIYEGRVAAENVLRSIVGRQLKAYKPVDLGYIIPMANNKSCGVVLGFKLKGFIPTIMHFIMCTYRLRGLKNKFGFLRNLFGIK